MKEAIKKAEVLIEALPYIKKFHNKSIIIKYGGSILENNTIRQGVLEDIVFLSYMGLRPILVHGGGPHISKRLRNLGKKAEFHEGIRITDTKTLKVASEELHALNQQIVKEVIRLGGVARGLSGLENKIITVKKKKARVNLGRVGQITEINKKPLTKVLETGAIVVICPMGKCKNDKDYNVNADEVASALASALTAEKLVCLTNVNGIMRNPDDKNSLMSTLTIEQANRLIKNNIIQQGMIPKVNACIEALSHGVKKTHIVNACVPRGLLLEIFTNKGIGTEIVK